MGRPKLRSSIRALQVAIAGLRPVGPICLQLAKTDSFRRPSGEDQDLCSTYNSIYCTVSSSSISSSHSSSSSSSVEALPPADPEAVPRGAILSTRFFFSPSTTKSIMEEAKLQGEMPVASSDEPKPEPEHGGEKEVFFSCDECLIMAMASEDPYRDFRVSMEEMVAAHGMREWPRLQELLHCYLRLNDKTTHKIIVLAFVDLLMSIMAQDKDGLAFTSLPLPLSLCDVEQ